MAATVTGIRIIAATLVAFGLALGGITAASASVTASHGHAAAEIRIAPTRACVTAAHRHAGAAVVARPCRDLASQRWIIGGGTVRLAGSHLRMVISRRSWLAVLEPSGRWRDDWMRDRRSHLRDMVLSRRFKAHMVLTLPSRHTPPNVGNFRQFRASEIEHADPFGGYQRVWMER